MNVNPILMKRLKPMRMPVHPEFHEGKGEEYITFNYADERPVLYADNADLYDSTVVHVHLYTRENPQNYKKRLRRYLRKGGFMILATVQQYEENTKYNHITVEVEIEGVIDDEMED